jgi:hypothetical protein
MNTQTIFCNDDIIYELWKHISVDSLKLVSVVSKDYNSQFKNMSDIEYISKKYKESDNVIDFISKTSKEICKKYNYPTPNFIYTLKAFFENKVSKIEKNGIVDDIYFIYYWIIILLHVVNNNYKEILIVIKKIDYKKQVNKPIIQLFLKLIYEKKYKIFGRSYSPNKYKLLRYISIYHIIMLSKNQFRKYKKYIETVHMKQLEMIKEIKYFEYAPNRWLFPKKFCLELIEIIEK